MVVVMLLLGTLGVSMAFGMMLLLPLYVQLLGGNEADFGVILSSAAFPAAFCIGLLLCYPDRLRPHVVVAIAIAVYAGGVCLGYGLALPNVQAQAVNVTIAALRPRILPLAGLLFQLSILVFPLVAGWLIVRLGYQALFAVLLLLVFAQAILGWWQFAADRMKRQERKPR